MSQRLSRLRERRAAGEGGFTLIELLVVVVIIGILIAIAIPVYLNYQKGAKDKSAASDLRNAIGVLEQCNSDNSTYPAAVSSVGVIAATAPTCTQTINLSSGTLFSYSPVGTSPLFTSYIIKAYNTGGSPKLYCYNSLTGGSVATLATTGYTAATPAGTFGTFTPAGITC